MSKQQTRKLCKMVCLSVCYSRVCIEINSNCIRLGQFGYEDLTGHGVCVVVHMVLVIQAGQLLTIPADRNQDLPLVLRADCQCEQIETGEWSRENTRPIMKCNIRLLRNQGFRIIIHLGSIISIVFKEHPLNFKFSSPFPKYSSSL